MWIAPIRSHPILDSAERGPRAKRKRKKKNEGRGRDNKVEESATACTIVERFSNVVREVCGRGVLSQRKRSKETRERKRKNTARKSKNVKNVRT